MKIAAALSGTPSRQGAPSRPLAAALTGSPPPGADRSELGADAAAAPEVPTAVLESSGTSVAWKLAGLASLGLVALTLVGCGPDGKIPGVPGLPGTGQPGSSQGQQQQKVETVKQRLDLLKSDKAAYAAFNEANYYRHVLGRIAQEKDPAAKAMVEAAQKGIEAFDVNGDPVKLRDDLRQVVTGIGSGEDAEGVVGRYQEMARAAVEVGFALRAQLPAGIAAQIKSQGYQKALDQVTTLPRRVDTVPIPESMKSLPDKVARDMLRNYAQTLAGSAEVALETGKEVGDPAVQAVLYETTVVQIYNRMSQDSTVFGEQLKSIIDAAMKLREQFSGR
ncbi:MAG: hypothetical protein HY319_18655 [Armatimonadetes bacterium]|nr:hypothetical protein [Armatimonadota bacterium]